MWKLKHCSRCGGDTFVERDKYGWYEQCLQCGYRIELETMVEAREKVSHGRAATGRESARARR